MSVASTSLESSIQITQKIKVPRNKDENRVLKEGHIEDNNEDISYFHFKLLWPNVIFTAVAAISLAVGIATSLKTDYIPSETQLEKGFTVAYGAIRYTCNSTLAIPSDGLISLLNLFEMNVSGNVFFRLCACLPMVVRIFTSLTVRCIMVAEYDGKLSFILKVANDIVPILTVIEVFSIGLFSIITVHSDFPEANRVFKMLFAFSSCCNMIIQALIFFAFSTKTNEGLDTFSIGTKVLCAILYFFFCPQYFTRVQSVIAFPICHSYLPRVVAYMEYVLFVTYAIFHLTSLIDIRHVTLMCYPRSSSGECEPLEPKNFEKGAKYEHCRAFEYNQRRIINGL